MIPKIFISYSVESNEHNEKVKNFAKKLRKQQMEVLLFGDMKLGERFGTFMEDIEKCDFVLFICTPQYKRRADDREGGVGYEWNIITSSVVNQSDELKFIPVLFSGDWDTSLPIWARGKKGVDYRKELESEFELLPYNYGDMFLEDFEKKIHPYDTLETVERARYRSKEDIEYINLCKDLDKLRFGK